MRLIIFPLVLRFLTACGNTQSASNAAANKGPSGTLYLRTYMWTGMCGSSLDISWLYFGDDGQIVRNPKHGVNPVQWDKEKTDNVANTGT